MHNPMPLQGDPKEIDEAWWRKSSSGEPSQLAIGVPFRPGLDPLPAVQEAWAIVKDR
jgi:hypothetical protein